MPNVKDMNITPLIGLGLKIQHHQNVLQQHPADLGWLEVHPENYFGGSKNIAILEEIRLSYPLSLHSVGMSLGSDQPIDKEYLDQLKDLIYRFQPFLVSSHAAWSATGNEHLSDLLPLPYTQETLTKMAKKIEQTQQYLGRQILIENPSTYVSFAIDEMKESEFLNQLVAKTGCGLLLDLNNAYIQSENHQCDPYAYLNALDLSSVQELHLAGHIRRKFDDGYLLIDTHNQKVSPEVWKLYEYTIKKIGPCYTLLEWDSDLPQFSDLLNEVWKAEKYLIEAMKNAA
jgi:uncharacterized protein (UPF0276 family)